MATSEKALQRYAIYDRLLQGGKGQTKKDLIKAVYDEMNERISDRTFEDDLYSMRYDEYLGYKAVIKYIPKKHYVYEDPNYTINASKLTQHQIRNLREAIKILSRFKTLPFMSHLNKMIEQLEIMQSGLKNNVIQDINPIIELEVPNQWPDSHILKDLYLAIKFKKEIRINYQPFQDSEMAYSRHKLKPLLIKEYQNRLYLIAINESGETRTYGLERIQNVIRLETRFKETFNSDQYFKYALGITVTNREEPHRIELLFGRTDANYVKTCRLHETQEIIREDKTGLHIAINVYKSEELVRMVRSFGSGVKVISPKWLADAVVEAANEVAKGILRN